MWEAIQFNGDGTVMPIESRAAPVDSASASLDATPHHDGGGSVEPNDARAASVDNANASLDATTRRDGGGHVAPNDARAAYLALADNRRLGGARTRYEHTPRRNQLAHEDSSRTWGAGWEGWQWNSNDRGSWWNSEWQRQSSWMPRRQREKRNLLRYFTILR